MVGEETVTEKKKKVKRPRLDQHTFATKRLKGIYVLYFFTFACAFPFVFLFFAAFLLIRKLGCFSRSIAETETLPYVGC